MNAGLPGTGIGGFFYLLLAVILPFVEFFYLIKGKSSKKNWYLVFKQLLISLGIIIGIETTGWFIQSAFGITPKDNLLHIKGYSSQIYVFNPFLLSLITLLSVILFIRILAFSLALLENLKKNQTN